MKTIIIDGIEYNLTPKIVFHEGDWVVYDHSPCQVVELPKEGYINLGLRRNGKIEFAPSTYCRPWTIQDAKGGDVLTNGDFPCIFKRCDGNGSLYVYCGINAHNDFSILSEDPENVWDDYSKQYFPATKEQRDLLFSKMKEAGYEWDAEKKELKEIEDEEYNGEDIIEKIDTYRLKEKKQGEQKPTLRERYKNIAESEWFKKTHEGMSVSDDEKVDNVNKIEQKPAWSEEDEEHYQACLQYFDAVNPDMVYYKDYQWLKSLKERIGE